MARNIFYLKVKSYLGAELYILCYNCIHFPDIFGVTIIYILKLGVTRVPTYIFINLIKKITVF